MMGIVAVRRVSTRILSLFVKNRRMSSIGSSKVSPCLVLKPNRTSYKFYSLEKQSEFDLFKEDPRESLLSGTDVEVLGDNTLKIVGSSYGWLALLNESNNDLYLSDPIRQRHLRLPNIGTLPDPHKNLIGGRGSVSKLILSCSPDRASACSALITYGVGDMLAWCSPLSSSSHWVPVGDLSPETITDYDIHHMKLYYDIVYCSGRKLFACLAFPFRIMFDQLGQVKQEFGFKHNCQLEFLQDTTPRWIGEDQEYLPHSRFNVDDDQPLPSWIDELSSKRDWPVQTTHLVYAEESDNLYLLVQLFESSHPVPLHEYNPRDPPPRGRRDRDFNNDAHLIFKQRRQHCKTAAFVAFRCCYDCDHELSEMTVADSLEGLAMFVGANQSFAISPSKFPELNLRPNSVYFTDVNGIRTNCTYNGNEEYEEGVDAGVFDYENNVILPLFKEPLPHEPFWFTPNE